MRSETVMHRLRRALSGTIAATAIVATAIAQDGGASKSTNGPHYRADGPDAEAYGFKDGYPMCEG